MGASVNMCCDEGEKVAPIRFLLVDKNHFNIKTPTLLDKKLYNLIVQKM
jgi:hypothetical protein